MKSYFQGVLNHIGKLDAAKLREQYRLAAKELALVESAFMSMKEGIAVVDGDGTVTRSNSAVSSSAGSCDSPANMTCGICRAC